jgi:chromosome partitioning protein
MPDQRAHIIVFGNEKGGSGKTTAAMHVAVALARAGKRVAAIDLDTGSGAFRAISKIARRVGAQERETLAMPEAMPRVRARKENRSMRRRKKKASGSPASRRRGERFDFIVIDTPGATRSCRGWAHASADTLVTPMNDSFVDFDLLARIDPGHLRDQGAEPLQRFRVGLPQEAVARAQAGARLGGDAQPHRLDRSAQQEAARRGARCARERIGFRVAPGFGERVIFRELFPMGLTMLDLPLPGLDVSLSMSHVAARQEVRELIATLKLPGR